ncbi:MAG: VanW family protein [Myxococcota bacterium]
MRLIFSSAGARILGASLCFLGSGAITLFTLSGSSEPAHAATPDPIVTVQGRQVDVRGDLEAQVHALITEWNQAPVVLRTRSGTHTLTRTRLGGSIDADHLRTLLEQAADPSSAMRRFHAALRPVGRLDLPVPVKFDASRLRPMLLRIKEELDRPARSARMDPSTRLVVPEQHGIQVDVWSTLDRVAAALERGSQEVELVHVREDPARTEVQLRDAKMEQLLGYFETRYDASGRAADRTHNMRVGGRKIDGYVVLPGEIFDFNEVVGPRNQASGFRLAPVIAGGELVDGVGGGACQIAGTLHAAAYFSGLEILERTPHSRPSSYIKLGLDAVVTYPQLNLRFRNDRDAPVVLTFSVGEGIVRSEVWGSGSRRMVSFVRRIDRWSAFEEREVQRSDLPLGTRVLAQRGVPGFTVRTWRIVRDLTLNQARRQASEDTYPATTQVWNIGTGEPPPEGYTAPKGDTHREYIADQFLTVTQGPPEGSVQTVRRAGKTGYYGWTIQEGMPGISEAALQQTEVPSTGASDPENSVEQNQ